MGIEQLQGKDWKPACAYSIAFWLIQCDAELYDEERTTSAVFQPVPYHYIEISRQLLMFAKDSFGANFHKVRLLLIAYTEETIGRTTSHPLFQMSCHLEHIPLTKEEFCRLSMEKHQARHSAFTL